MGDFNEEPTDKKISGFLTENDLYNHIRENTCFKSEKGKCIDLILSNKRSSLQHSTHS